MFPYEVASHRLSCGGYSIGFLWAAVCVHGMNIYEAAHEAVQWKSQDPEEV